MKDTADMANTVDGASAFSDQQLADGMAGLTDSGELLPRFARPNVVLLVHLDAGEVAYASPSALELAPGLGLPFALPQWLKRTGLDHPEICGMRHVEIPLTDAAGLAAYALVAVVPLTEEIGPDTLDGDAHSEREIRDRAVSATGLSFTVADMRQPDQPLIWVNPAFSATTGYSFEEAVGRNCRFLQGPDTDPTAHMLIRAAIDAGDELVISLLNYRKDGSTFINEVALNPVRDVNGVLTHYVGIQSDVTAREHNEREREAALREAQDARREAERATELAQQSRRRLALLAEASSLLGRTLDVDETFERLLALVVPLLADWVIVVVKEDDGLRSRTIVRDRDGRLDLTGRVAELLVADVNASALTRQVMETGQPQLRSRYEAAELDAAIDSPELRELVHELGAVSALSVPLSARGRQLGVMSFISGVSGREYDEDDLRIVADLGRRAGITLDNARMYSFEHQTALTLQRALLPDIPELPNVAAAARYLPGHSGAAVGGDFYELLDLPDGGIGVAIGDVVGHDMTAAAAMGHLRGLLRACAWDTAADDGGSPAKVLERVDRLVRGLHVAPLATVFYGRFDRLEDGWHFSYSNAGHPAPMLVQPDGTVRVLVEGAGLLLGVEGTDHETVVTTVAPGSTLLLYTDGLIERRGADIDTGVEWLAGFLAGSQNADPDGLLDRLLAEVTSFEDDIAVLAIRLGPD